MMTDSIKSIRRQHRAGSQEVFAAPGALVPVEWNPETPAGLIEDPDALRHDLLANAIAGDQRDLELLHCTLPLDPRRLCMMLRALLSCDALTRQSRLFWQERYPVTRDFGEHTS